MAHLTAGEQRESLLMTPIDQLRRKLLLVLIAWFLSLALIVSLSSRLRATTKTLLDATWLLILLGVLALRLVFSAYNSTRPRPDSVPRVKGRLPGNIDILWKLVRNEQSEYCAATLRDWEAQYGPTYDMNILWSHQVCIPIRALSQDSRTWTESTP